MADADKNILITPNVGQTTEPTIVFTGADNNPVTLRVLDNGTLSIEGSSGQLFSVTDSLTGTIFAVNDISGVPSIEVIDDGTIRLAEIDGNVGIGVAAPSTKLEVVGTVTATAIDTASVTNSTTNQDLTLSTTGTGSVVIENIGITDNTISSINSDGNVIVDPNGTGQFRIIGTNAMLLPVGNGSTERPTGEAGLLRYNSSISKIEWYNGSAWVSPDTAGGEVNQNAFSTVTGDTGTANADSATDSIAITGGSGTGITTTAADTPDSLTITLDSSTLTSTASAGTDELVFFDTTDSSNPKKTTVTNLIADNSIMTSFTIADDSSTTTTINQGDTLTIAGGTNVTTVVTGDAENPVITINATDTNTNTTYDFATSTSATGNSVDLDLTGSDATTDTVTVTGGSNITITRDSATQFTITGTGGAGAFDSFTIADDTSTTTVINDGDTLTIAGGTDITSVVTNDTTNPVITLNNASTLDTVTGRGATTTNSVTVGELSVDNININGNTISSTDTNGNIILDPNGNGGILINSVLDTSETLKVQGYNDSSIAAFGSRQTITDAEVGSNITGQISNYQFLELSGSGTVSASRNHRNLYVDTNTNFTNSSTGPLRVTGIYSDLQNQKDVEYLTAISGTVDTYHASGDNTTTRIIGVAGDTYLTSTGTVTDQYASWFYNGNYGGTITNAYGVRSDVESSSGTISNSYLFYGVQTGSVSNTGYGVYVTGEDANYFSNNVGIGTATPTNKLEVDNIGVTGNTISSTNTNGNIILDPNGTGGVGIGTTSPSEILHITSSVTKVVAESTNTAQFTGSSFILENGATANKRGVGFGSFIRDADSSDSYFAIDGLDNTNSYEKTLLYYDLSADTFILKTANTDRLTISSAGQLTAGTGYTPSAALDLATKGYVDTELSSTGVALVSLVATNTTNSTHFITFTEAATGDEEVRTDTDLTYNPSTNTLTATNFSGTASQAQYADLAEKYLPDTEYSVGTVMQVGGEHEVTACSELSIPIGVVSDKPAYLMNSELAGGVALALVGRVPVRVVGKIYKGDPVYVYNNGLVSKTGNGQLVGVALETNENTNEKLVECVLKI